MPSLSGVGDFVQLLVARAEHRPEGLAFAMANEAADAETRVTYADLHTTARRVAMALADRGLAGQRVLLLLHPGENYIAGFVGCWYAGATAVPVYAPRPNASFQRIRLIAEDCGAGAILSTSQILSTLDAGFAPGVPRLAIDTLVQQSGAESLWRQPEAVGADTLAVLQYTSGSTGNPKGVRLCHRHLIENSRIILDAIKSTSETVGVMWVPPYHDMGLIGGILHPLYGGFPVHLMSPAAFLQRPMRWLESISRHRGTMTAAPNFAFDLCVRRAKPEQIEKLDLSSWRVACNGAEPIRAETLKRFADTFAPAGFDARAFYPCYGMAETTLLVAGSAYYEGAVTAQVDRAELAAGRLTPLDGSGTELVSSGRVAGGVDVAIVDTTPDSGPRRCAEGEVGEIWVSGATVADGYWERPDANRETFQARLPGSDAAWLCTGDLGALQGGELFVTGRIKDLIVIHGHNHYPQDIEATALAAHAALRPQGAAAFAIDGATGEELGLVLELERGHHNDDVEAIRVAVVEAISHEHQLHVGQMAFIKANTLPKTSSGKVQRRATRERLLAGEFDLLGAELPA